MQSIYHLAKGISRTVIITYSCQICQLPCSSVLLQKSGREERHNRQYFKSHKKLSSQLRCWCIMTQTLIHSQLYKEGLAVMFGIKHFYKYINGWKFTIVTDHKLLLSLLSEIRGVPQTASRRIQRWAVTLRAYEYTIVYKEGKYHSNADAPSRLSLPEKPDLTNLFTLCP